MPAADSHCEKLVREADKDRFLATLFAPAERRGALYALYAFDLEVAGVRERISEPLPGEIRLQWWSDVLDGTRETGGHPVADALRDAISRHGLPVSALQDLIDARTFDLYGDPMGTLAELEEYARRTSSALITLAARILDEEQPPTIALTRAGIVDAITGLLRAFAFRAARGQVYVPEEILARHGVRREDLLAGKSDAGLGAALAELRAHARGHLELLREPLAALPPRLTPALLPVAVARLYLDRMDRPDYDPFKTPVEVAQWRRQWALWRAARAPRRIASGYGSERTNLTPRRDP